MKRNWFEFNNISARLENSGQNPFRHLAQETLVSSLQFLKKTQCLNVGTPCRREACISKKHLLSGQVISVKF